MNIAVNRLTGKDSDKGNAAFFTGVSTKKAFFNIVPNTAHGNGYVYAIAQVPANGVHVGVSYVNEAITGGTDYDVGLINREGISDGVVSADCLVNGADLSSANTSLVTVVPSAANFGKKYFELAGGTKGSAGWYVVAIKANAIGSTADRGVAGYIEYIDNVN